MLSLFQSNSNDNLEEAIRYEDKELNECVKIMVEISCIEIYTFYLEQNQIDITNQIVKMIGAKNNIISEILKKIFGFNSKTGYAFESVSPTALFNLFKKDGYV